MEIIYILKEKKKDEVRQRVGNGRETRKNMENLSCQ